VRHNGNRNPDQERESGTEGGEREHHQRARREVATPIAQLQSEQRREPGRDAEQGRGSDRGDDIPAGGAEEEQHDGRRERRYGADPPLDERVEKGAGKHHREHPEQAEGEVVGSERLQNRLVCDPRRRDQVPVVRLEHIGCVEVEREDDPLELVGVEGRAPVQVQDQGGGDCHRRAEDRPAEPVRDHQTAARDREHDPRYARSTLPHPLGHARQGATR
jgi:hypothetical protein